MYFLEVVDWLLMEIATKTSLDQKNMTMTRQKKIATYILIYDHLLLVNLKLSYMYIHR